MLLSLDEKRRLAARVRRDGYYTDGVDVWEIIDIGSTGCVWFRGIRDDRERCLGIVEFRRWFWLVKERQAA